MRVVHAQSIARQTTPYEWYEAQVASCLPPGSRVLGLQHYWLGLRQYVYRTWLLPIGFALPRYSHEPISFDQALDQVDPTVILVDRYIDDLMEETKAPEHPNHVLYVGFEAFKARRHAKLTCVIQDHTYGPMQVYWVPAEPRARDASDSPERPHGPHQFGRGAVANGAPHQGGEMGVLLTSSQPSQTRVGQRSSGFSIRHRLAEISEVPTSLRRRSLLVDPNLRNGVVHDTPRRVGGEAKREIVIVDEGYPFVKPQGSRELGPYQHRLNGHAGLGGQNTIGDPPLEWAPRAAVRLSHEPAGCVDQFVRSVTPRCPSIREAFDLENQFARSPAIVGIQERDPLATSLIEPDVSDSRDVAAMDMSHVPQARLGETAYPALSPVCRSVVYDNHFPVRQGLRLDRRTTLPFRIPNTVLSQNGSGVGSGTAMARGSVPTNGSFWDTRRLTEEPCSYGRKGAKVRGLSVGFVRDTSGPSSLAQMLRRGGRDWTTLRWSFKTGPQR